MPRLNIANLRSKRKFRRPEFAVKKTGSWTKDRAEKEDAYRSRAINKTLPMLTDHKRKEARRLAERLTYESDVPATLSSSAHYEEKRQPVLDALVKLTLQHSKWDMKVVTLLPRGSPVQNLDGFNSKVFLERLRADLTRAGARKAKGWIFAAVHGEYRDNPQGWYPHYHLVVVGKPMIAAVKRLREQRKYQPPSAPPPSGKTKWPPPVLLQKVKRDELRYCLSYILQAWWPHRWESDDDGKRHQRGTTHRRIPGVDHTKFLIWLDRQKFQNMILLFNLHVGRGGLRVTK